MTQALTSDRDTAAEKGAYSLTILTDRRDATVQLQADREMSEDSRREATAWLLVIEPCLGDGHTNGNGQGSHVA